jgi:hypothetical protein
MGKTQKNLELNMTLLDRNAIYEWLASDTFTMDCGGRIVWSEVALGSSHRLPVKSTSGGFDLVCYDMLPLSRSVFLFILSKLTYIKFDYIYKKNNILTLYKLY